MLYSTLVCSTCAHFSSSLFSLRRCCLCFFVFSFKYLLFICAYTIILTYQIFIIFSQLFDICTVHWPLYLIIFFFHSTLILLVLFLSFLLNIYMCIYSYTDTAHSYKCANNNVVQCFGLFNPCALFIMPFLFFLCRCCLCFFVFSFKYLLFICAYTVTPT